MLKKIITASAIALVSGPAGYLWTRFLVALGVPFDAVAIAMANHTKIALSTEVIFWGVTTLFALIFWGIGIFGVARMVTARKSVETRNKPLIELDIIASSLKMTVGESGPYLHTYGRLYSVKRTFNLKLENTDRKTAVSNCLVHIQSVTPPTEYEGPWQLKSGMSLAAGQHVFLPLVTYGEAREPSKFSCGDTFMTMGTDTGRPHLNADCQYVVRLRATAPETAYCDFQFKVWVNDEGRLRIEPYEDDNHNLNYGVSAVADRRTIIG